MIFYRYAVAEDAEILLRIRREAVLSNRNEHYSYNQLIAWAPEVNNATITAEAEALNNPDRITIIAAVDSDESDYSLHLTPNNSSVQKPGRKSIMSKMVGLCTIGISEGLLKQCYVLQQYRGKGIAKGLVRIVEDIARENGLSYLKLSSSLIAFRFYEKLGYQAIERYDYDLEEGLIMECVMMYREL